MSTGMGTTASDEVAPGAPQPTHIDVHIHQELLSFPRQPSTPSTPTRSQLLGSRRVLVASWVVQIVMGLLSGALGGLGCFLFFGHWTQSTYETGIWAGVVAMLAGVTVFIHEKRGGTCWAVLRALLALAAFATAIAAIHIGANRFYYGYYWDPSRCWLHSFQVSTLPPGTPEKRRAELCRSYQNMIQAMSMGLQAILLSVWALLLLASLMPLLLFCWRRLRPKAEKDQKALLGASETLPCLS